MSPGTGIYPHATTGAPASPSKSVICSPGSEALLLRIYVSRLFLSSWRTDSFFVQNASCSINNTPVLYSEGVCSLPSVLI